MQPLPIPTILAYLLFELSISVTSWDCSSNIRSKLRSLRQNGGHQTPTDKKRPDSVYSSLLSPLGGNSHAFFLIIIIFGCCGRLPAQLFTDVHVLLLQPLHLSLEETRHNFCVTLQTIGRPVSIQDFTLGRGTLFIVNICVRNRSWANHALLGVSGGMSPQKRFQKKIAARRLNLVGFGS